MDDLTVLADKYGSDKGSIKHNYTKAYNKYFNSIRDKDIKLFEIGFAKGASAKMWLSYFKNSDVYFIDILKEIPKEFEKYDNFHFATVDQTDLESLHNFVALDERSFDIIIDDGSHVPEDEMFTLGYLFSYLSPGGLYIIEDLNCKRNHNKSFSIKERKMVDVLKEYNKTGVFKSKLLTKNTIDAINKNIEKVELYCNDKIAFITKKG